MLLQYPRYRTLWCLTKTLLVFGFFLAPLIGIAGTPNPVAVDSLLTATLDIVKDVVQIVLILAVVIFGWGIIRLIAASGDPSKIKEAKAIIMWGVIGITLLASLYGTMKFIRDYIGIPEETAIHPPKFDN